jgi:hypothetical protein
MCLPVKLREVVEEMQMIPVEAAAYINRNSGERVIHLPGLRCCPCPQSALDRRLETLGPTPSPIAPGGGPPGPASGGLEHALPSRCAAAGPWQRYPESGPGQSPGAPASGRRRDRHRSGW